MFALATTSYLYPTSRRAPATLSPRSLSLSPFLFALVCCSVEQLLLLLLLISLWLRLSSGNESFSTCVRCNNNSSNNQKSNYNNNGQQLLNLLVYSLISFLVFIIVWRVKAKEMEGRRGLPGTRHFSVFNLVFMRIFPARFVISFSVRMCFFVCVCGFLIFGQQLLRQFLLQLLTL